MLRIGSTWGWAGGSAVLVALGLGLSGCGAGFRSGGGGDDSTDPEDTPCDPVALCDDGDPCTKDECHEDGSCTYSYSTAECDDGNPCTKDDFCLDGECLGIGYDCDDGDLCTIDICNGDGTCSYEEGECPEELPEEQTVWRGYYNCPGAQGVTGLDLTTTRNPSNNQVTAVFEFYPLPQNPGVESGSWLDRGTYDPNDNSMLLLPVQWIDQPPGWTYLGMEGVYDNEQQKISGTILKDDGSPTSKCDAFLVERVDP